MNGTAIALCAALSIEQTDGQVPEWVHLLPVGAVRTVDGRGPYTVTDLDAIVAESMKGGKLVLDENHATDHLAPKGGSAPARAWITELQAREDGIWGKAAWTPEGRSVVAGYRGISPAVVHRKDGVVLAIARASLTNTPNFRGLTSLHSEETSMDFRAWLIEALGLGADVDDAAIKAAMTEAMKKSGGDPAVALHSALNPIGAVVGVAAGADAATVLAGVQRLKAGTAGDENETITALQSELTDVTTRFNTHLDATARKDATAFVDGAIAAGRVGVKAQRDRYISMHMRDAGEAVALITSMPIVAAGATLTGDPAPGADGIGGADEAVIALMGIDRTAYAATLAAEGRAIA